MTYLDNEGKFDPQPTPKRKRVPVLAVLRAMREPRRQCWLSFRQLFLVRFFTSLRKMDGTSTFD